MLMVIVPGVFLPVFRILKVVCLAIGFSIFHTKAIIIKDNIDTNPRAVKIIKKGFIGSPLMK